jgi:hypothetical protein
MNPYLDHFNGLLVLPELLKDGNIRYEDLPVLNWFQDPTLGRSTVCWSHVLGPCHNQDCYFAARGSHLGHDDYMEEFANNVVAMLGQAVATCMAANPQGSPEKGKKQKADQTPDRTQLTGIQETCAMEGKHITRAHER